jgi:hypothetical protein
MSAPLNDIIFPSACAVAMLLMVCEHTYFHDRLINRIKYILMPDSLNYMATYFIITKLYVNSYLAMYGSNGCSIFYSANSFNQVE